MNTIFESLILGEQDSIKTTIKNLNKILGRLSNTDTDKLNTTVDIIYQSSAVKELKTAIEHLHKAHLFINNIKTI